MVREQIIFDFVRGKEVLDIGCTGQTDAYNLHERVQREARSLTGIDTVPSKYPNVVHGNMETYQFGRQFDVVLAGDVIEHVDNQGAFLANIHKHLKDDGSLIITTPNAKWLTVILKPNPTHTLWHDRYTLAHLLDRHKFQITYFCYYYGNKPYYNPLFRILALRQGMLVMCQKVLDDQEP